ncbi:MAG: regulatory iron-sulfur-containing complex subunit RicT [Thermaerobacter sp.]|nr:regulatory iron-sulfur-containing complex subunit RicT [Thermaerobacter sp.]
MAQAVGIRFRSAGKVFDFDPAGQALQYGDRVVVSTVHGQELGWVAREQREVEPEAPLRQVVREADYADMEQGARMRDNAEQAFDAALETVDQLDIEMDLVEAEYTLDGHHLTFYFTAEGRVDFRELVRELNGRFPCRVELRQIGVRDEAKILGGLGMCGRPMCCSTFLTEFQSVSIRMAKDQGLSLNPSRITGNCGRLLCCLRFEQPDGAEAVAG